MSSIIVEEWRDLWSFKVDFVFVAVAYVFSTSNFLNLPSLIVNNGGLAFLVAYGASLLLCCLPLIIMELTVGQVTGRGPVQALFNICPLFKGVGVAHILYSLAIMSYLAVWLGYVFLFIFYMLYNITDSELPWMTCHNFWNNETCQNVTDFMEPRRTVEAYQSSLSQFLDGHLKNSSGTMEDIGQLQWRSVAALGAVWVLVLLAIVAGVRWLGKVCYFTFLIPLLLLIAVVVRALTLPGAIDTILAYQEQFGVEWEKLLELQTWSKAFAQSFYATGVGFGAYITLGSYNKRTNNLVCDGFIIVFFHILTGALLLAAALGLVAWFAYIGNPNDSIVAATSFKDLFLTDGRQLQQIIMIVGQLPMAKVWTGILLFMVALILLNTFYMLSLSILATLEDAFGEKASRCLPRTALALVLCLVACAAGLGHTLRTADYTIELMHKFLDYITLWVIIAFEILAVAWFYCGHTLGKEIKHMIRPACCWVTGYGCTLPLYLLPAVPIYVAVTKLLEYDFSDATFSSQLTKTSWAEPVGWAIAVVPLLPIPLYMIYVVIKTCIRGPGITKWQKFKYTVISPLRYEVVKPQPPPRYTATAPGYVLLPQAPLAEHENYNDVYTERVVRVSNI